MGAGLNLKNWWNLGNSTVLKKNSNKPTITPKVVLSIPSGIFKTNSSAFILGFFLESVQLRNNDFSFILRWKNAITKVCLVECFLSVSRESSVSRLSAFVAVFKRSRVKYFSKLGSFWCMPSVPFTVFTFLSFFCRFFHVFLMIVHARISLVIGTGLKLNLHGIGLAFLIGYTAIVPHKRSTTIIFWTRKYDIVEFVRLCYRLRKICLHSQNKKVCKKWIWTDVIFF